METIKIEDPNFVGIRLDKFLGEYNKEYSRGFIQTNIQEENIKVNDTVKKPSYKLKLNDVITIGEIELKELEVLAEEMNLKIIYEDDDLIVIDKPQGMVVHPAPGNYSGTLVNGLLHHCNGQLSGINGFLRPGIVHRIDKNTSGVLVVAKSDLAHRGLSKQLEEHTMTRIYRAVVLNNIKNDEGTIDKPIARSNSDRKKMEINKDGRHAVTHYKVIERFGTHTLIELKLETGRTHQIRVHMTAVGNPLLGDDKYSNAKSKYNLLGQVLHAKLLGFNHPRTGEYMEFESEDPEYLNKVLRDLRSLAQKGQ